MKSCKGSLGWSSWGWMEARYHAAAIGPCDPETVGDDKWCVGPTTMRKLMREQTGARLVLGGKFDGYKGAMPGVAEDALLAMKAKPPVFLVGGFGGCARDIAETLDIADRWSGSQATRKGCHNFNGYTPDDLNNGLTPAENRRLPTTHTIDQPITLVLLGLYRLGQGKG